MQKTFKVCATSVVIVGKTKTARGKTLLDSTTMENVCMPAVDLQIMKEELLGAQTRFVLPMMI